MTAQTAERRTYTPRHARTQPRQPARPSLLSRLLATSQRLCRQAAASFTDPVYFAAHVPITERTIERKQVEGHPDWPTADFPNVAAAEGLAPETTPEQRREWFRRAAVFNEMPQLAVAPELAKVALP